MTRSSNSGDRNLVFISYSHADAKWLARLRVHLKPLERHGVVVPWDDTKIRPGAEWREEIRNALESARVAVLLVSADFLASDFIATNELPPLLQAAEAHGTRILPLILDHCRFEKTEGLSRFQAVNNPSKPLATLNRSHREAWFHKLSGIIEEALEVAPKEPTALPREEPRPKDDSTKIPIRELAKRHVLRLRFWEQLLDLARQKGMSFHANRSPSTSNWIGGKTGITGYRWNYVIYMDGAAIELDIDTGDKRKNKRLFDALRSRKAEIEHAFGAPLEWQRLDDARRSGVRYVMREGGLTAPETEWPRIQASMVEALARLSEVFQPHLQLRAGASLKYQPLGVYLAARQNEPIVRLSFTEIEEMIAGLLPTSANQYREWWSNQSDTSNRPQAAAWLNAGFKVDSVDQENGWVEFVPKDGPSAQTGTHNAETPNESGINRKVQYQQYTVRQLVTGSIEIELEERQIKPVKPTLRQIASELGIGLLNRHKNPLNTRQLGALIIEAVERRNRGGATPPALPRGGAQERSDPRSRHTADNKRFINKFYAHAAEIALDDVTAPTERLIDRNVYWDDFDAAVEELSAEDRRSRQEANTVHNLRKYGLSVAQLKQALQELGFYNGAIDDEYVDAIAEALKRFQKAFNLRHVDGYFGPLTYTKMAEVAYRLE